MGLLKRHDLPKRTLMSEKSTAIAWECPAVACLKHKHTRDALDVVSLQRV